MKQQSQQFYLSSNYLPTTSADIVSTEATQQNPNSNSNKSVKKFNHLNTLIEEFNKEFSQNNSNKNINLNDSRSNCIQNDNKEVDAKFYKSTPTNNSNIQNTNYNSINSIQGSSNNNEIILIKQLKRNEILLNKAHDIINNFRTDIHMENLTQQINNKIQMHQNSLNNVLNTSVSGQNQQYMSQSFINAQSYNNQFNSKCCSTNLNISTQQQFAQKKRNKSFCNEYSMNNTLPLKDEINNHSNNAFDLDLQDKLYQSNKNLQENIIKLNDANKIIKQLQDLDLKQKEQIENYSKQYENMKQKLKISLNKLKELKDRESQRELEISSIIQCNDTSQLLNDEKRDLERRLSATIKYNEDLFQNYSNILKINSELQNKILEYEQENLLINEQLKEFRGQMNLLKFTEYKVENLENNISRIEESSTMTVPELQKKVKQVQDECNQKVEILGYCTEFIESQLNKTVSGLQKILQDTDIPVIGQKSYLTFPELHETANITKQLDMKKIISKLDISQQLQQIMQYFCTISYAIAFEHFQSTMQPIIQGIDRKILLIETILPKLKSYIIKIKSQNTKENNVSVTDNNDLSSVFLKNQKNSQNQRNEFSKVKAQSRQSLSFKKEQFDEYIYFNQENVGDFANQQKSQKDLCQMDLITNSMSSNHLFKIHDTPDKKSQEEELNIKLLQIVNNGIKKYDDLSHQMNSLHKKLEMMHKNIQQSNGIEFQIKGELSKLSETSITLSKNIELSELFIKKELGIIKAEIDYNLKLQRQMDLPKIM